MISLEDRRSLAQDIDTANAAGARLHLACSTAGIDLRTLQRWKASAGLQTGDGRPSAARPIPGHALSVDERAKLLQVANEPRFAAVPPARIVPMLADEGIYIASESSFSRVLRSHGQTAHRGRAFPVKGFVDLQQARAWAADFVHWYNLSSTPFPRFPDFRRSAGQ